MHYSRFFFSVDIKRQMAWNSIGSINLPIYMCELYASCIVRCTIELYVLDNVE